MSLRLSKTMLQSLFVIAERESESDQATSANLLAILRGQSPAQTRRTLLALERRGLACVDEDDSWRACADGLELLSQIKAAACRFARPTVRERLRLSALAERVA